MPFISSIFSLLLIAGLMTWINTYRTQEHAWARQTILFTRNMQDDVFENRLSDRVFNNYAKLLPTANEPQHDEVEEVPQDRKAERKAIIKEKRREGRLLRKASRVLHISSLFDQGIAPDDQHFKASYYLVQNLANQLFHNQEFYLQMASPMGFDGIDFETFFKAAIDLGRKCAEVKSGATKAYPLKRAEDLANLELSSLAEQHLLYKMLRGGSAGVVGSAGSYQSLLEFISLERRNTILSLYLAPRQILNALFNNNEIVDQICTYRQELLKKLKKGEGTKEELQQQFQNEFASQLPPEVPANLIDFQVTLTRPVDMPKSAVLLWLQHP